MGNGASGGVDVDAAALALTLPPRYHDFIKRFAQDGIVPGAQTGKMREAIAEQMIKKDEWWTGVDATKIPIGEEQGKQPQTADEKMRAMFEWADKDWDGYLNLAEANKLQAVSNPDQSISEEMWAQVAQQIGFDPKLGFNFEQAKTVWEDYEDDYKAIFGRRQQEAEAAQKYIKDVNNSWRTMLLSKGKGTSWWDTIDEDEDKPKPPPGPNAHKKEDVQTDTAEHFVAAAKDELITVLCDEPTSNLAFAWLQRAIKTPHEHPRFKEVKTCVRTLLSSDAFWKGLGCTGNAWTRRGNLHDDDEWTEFGNLCKEELKKIGTRFGGFYADQELGDKIGSLGADVNPGAPVRQPHPPCPNMELAGPGADFLNDGKGENQYIMHIHLLSQAFNGRFQAKVAKAVAASLEAGSSSVKHGPAPVKTMLRMYAKLRSDHMPNEAPRPAANIDTIRCGVACATPEDLKRTYEAVVKEFDGKVARVKNGYAKSYDPNISFHYRGLLMNLEWHTGVTYGELLADPAVMFLWDLVACHIRADKKATMAKLAGKLKPMRVVDWFGDEAIKDQEVVMMVEVQLMLDHYMEMRQHTHLFYKVIREPSWVDLALDCLPDNVEVFPSRFSAGEHLQRAGAFFEMLAGSDDDDDEGGGGGGGGSDSDSD